MSTLQGLLVGCAESPHDSTPHLILADWLEDHGHSARAELVRIQCRLADWEPDWQQRLALIQRQDELIARHRETWLGPMLNASPQVEFVRGLTRLWVTGRSFSLRALGAALDEFHETALIEEIRLIRCTSLKTLAVKPWMAHLPALSLAHLDLDLAALTWLLQSSEARHLVRLDLSGNRLNGPLWPRNVVLRQLTHLSARLTGLTDAGFTALRTRLGDRPVQLDLFGNPLAPAQLAEIGQAAQPIRRVNSLGMEFVEIPPGSFRMGAPNDEPGRMPDEVPQHTVHLTRPFWLGRFAVTQAQYEQVFSDNGSAFRGPYRPMERVTWTRAVEFCEALSRLPAEQAAGRSYRLPTEAEREHACRAGTFTAFHLGPEHSMERINCQQRFSTNESARNLLNRTSDVGSYPPNAFGLYDMHGNVWEWCQDWYATWYSEMPEATKLTDPAGPLTGAERVARGGCWEAIGSYCRAAKRLADPPETVSNHIGFRVVLVQNGQEPSRSDGR